MKNKMIVLNVILLVAACAFYVGKSYGTKKTWEISQHIHFTDRAGNIKERLTLLKLIDGGDLEKIKKVIASGVDIELGVLSRYADVPVAKRDRYVIEAITMAHQFRSDNPHETPPELVDRIARTAPLVDSQYKAQLK